MSKWGFYFDQTRCINCKACVLACKAWNHKKRGDKDIHPDREWLPEEGYAEPRQYGDQTGEQNYSLFSRYHMKENWRRVTTEEIGTKPPDIQTRNLSISCNHCDQPTCIPACPAGCLYKDPNDGIVRVDASRACVPCRKCQKACPWNSPQFYDASPYYEEKAKPDMTKCDLCTERIRAGRKPACVAGCMMRALDAGPMQELKDKYPEAALMLSETGANLLIKEKII